MATTGRHQKLVTRTSLATEQGQGQYHGRVLVVEDNVVNQQVAKRFLQRLGCEVVVAENGKRGVEEYFQATPEGSVQPRAHGRADARHGRPHRSPRDPPPASFPASACPSSRSPPAP